jgi:signal transduction histidine kinase
VHVALVETGDTAEIRVTDAGTGVPAHMTEKLFQRFATGERGSGTGLGLFIVRELARAHGGDAGYETPRPGQPSGTFVIDLPKTGGPAT